MPESHLEIVPVSYEAIPLIRELTYQVWPQTYRGVISDDQIEYMLDMMYSEDSLRRQMEEGAQFLIIFEKEKPVGFASYQKLSKEIYKLHKIYVLPSQQKKGTGKFIIDYILNQLQTKGAKALHLQVNKNNAAKSFYEKLGFTVIEEIKLDIGKGYVMDDYIMAKLITNSEQLIENTGS